MRPFTSKFVWWLRGKKKNNRGVTLFFYSAEALQFFFLIPWEVRKKKKWKKIWRRVSFFSSSTLRVEHKKVIDPRGRPAVTIFARVVCPFVLFKISQNKTIFKENSDHYWRDCESGRVDHWWQLSCKFLQIEITLHAKLMNIFATEIQLIICYPLFNHRK